MPVLHNKSPKQTSFISGILNVINLALYMGRSFGNEVVRQEISHS